MPEVGNHRLTCEECGYTVTIGRLLGATRAGWDIEIHGPKIGPDLREHRATCPECNPEHNPGEEQEENESEYHYTDITAHGVV